MLLHFKGVITNFKKINASKPLVGLFLFNLMLLKIVVKYYSKQTCPIHDFTNVTLAFDEQQQLTAHKSLPSSDNLGITSFTNETNVELYKTAKTHHYILISQ